MQEIKIGDQTALVDEEDYSDVAKYAWRIKDGYANSNIKGSTVGMHQLVGRNIPKVLHCMYCNKPHKNLQKPADDPDWELNHIDRNRLNNTRSNLEWVTRYMNCMQREAVDGTSKYRGVRWRDDVGKWRAEIQVQKTKFDLGHYTTEEEGAIAYDRAAIYEYGRFAILNFPHRDYADAHALRREHKPCPDDTSNS
ncbi:MAG: hypothetical protein NVS9B9_10240 [Ktedonobacteraceae bacterium]